MFRPELYIKLQAKLRRQYKTHNLIEISESAILNNFDIFSKFGYVMPVLKSNAYGHGIEQVATILQKRTFPYICVDGYFEAMRVRSVTAQPVLIMGAISKENFAKLNYDRFAFMVQDKATIEALGKTRKKIKIHLDIDTGMNRYGIDPEELDEILELIASYKKLDLEGVATHLADADNTDNSYTRVQVRLFDSLVAKIFDFGLRPTLIHIANSPGAAKVTSEYANAIRPGLGFYGINPLESRDRYSKRLSRLKPALRFTSTITKVRKLKKGEKISYNGTYVTKNDIRIGVVPVGYFEGMPRELSNKGKLIVAGKVVPVLGRVCMNHTVVDLSGIKAGVGAKAIVISNNPTDVNSAKHFSEDAGVFDYGLVSKLSPDVRRVIIK